MTGISSQRISKFSDKRANSCKEYVGALLPEGNLNHGSVEGLLLQQFLHGFPPPPFPPPPGISLFSICSLNSSDVFLHIFCACKSFQLCFESTD